MSYSRRHFLLGSLALPAFAADKPAERPNVVLLLADNLPAWVLGIYGNKEVQTPHIDRLAQMGTRFSRHFTTSPVPGLGRATLLTGRTPMQLRGAEDVPAGEPGLEKSLAAAGYECSAADPPGAVTWLDSAPSGKPFFVTVRCGGPTPPYDNVPQKFRDMYAQTRFNTFPRDPAAPNARAGKELLADTVGNLRKYAAAVSALDEQVQSVVAKIYARKLQDRTAIVFTSTCGALLGRHGLWGAGDASEPPNMYEESVATPLIISWVGDVPAQGIRPEVVSAYDLAPTLYDITATPPPAANLCGRSYRALATGKRLPDNQRWPTTVFGHYRNTEMARMDRYKLVIRDQGSGPGELYDLRADAAEKTNQYEDAGFVTVRRSLTAAVAQWRQKYSA